jgi:Prokaryotic phospholipase A2
MKRWTRQILVVLLGALAVSYLGMAPAQAAKTDTVVTYRGYTVSWSEPDASDVRVVRTPGRPESFPAKASDRSIQQAKARVAAASDQVDSCTLVPDVFLTANFQPACALHDLCYAQGSEFDRLECDLVLLSNLIQACNNAPGLTFAQRLSCYAVASIYFIGVRLFGEDAYQGEGSSA